MAKLNGTRKLFVEDFDTKDRALVGKLAFTLNPFLNSVVDALDRNLTINDNLNASEITIQFTAPASKASPIKTKTELNTNCIGTLITSVENLDNNNEILASAPFIQFNNSDDNQIQIYNVTGLTSGNRYRVRVILFGA